MLLKAKGTGKETTLSIKIETGSMAGLVAMTSRVRFEIKQAESLLIDRRFDSNDVLL